MLTKSKLLHPDALVPFIFMPEEIKDNNKKQRIINFLYHLSKGLCKAIPVAGSVIEEVVYEQYKDKLTKKVNGLTSEEIEEIFLKIQSINIDMLNQKLNQLSDKINWGNLQILTELLETKIESIEQNTASIPAMLAIINEVKNNINDKNAIAMAMDNLLKRREEWISRISKNQKILLNSIPEGYTPLSQIWNMTKDLLPECGYKEFRFRLHELEWLSLVDRYRDNETHEWHYKRSSAK